LAPHQILDGTHGNESTALQTEKRLPPIGGDCRRPVRQGAWSRRDLRSLAGGQRPTAWKFVGPA